MAVELTVGHLDRSSRPFNWVKAPLIPVISRVRIYTKTYICGEFWLGLNSPIKLIRGQVQCQDERRICTMHNRVC